MLDCDQLHRQVVALDRGDDASRRQALQALKHHDEQEWSTAPSDVCQLLVLSLRGQLRGGAKSPFALKEAIAVLGRMGSRARAAVPQLIEIVGAEVPDAVRESAVIALGKVGEEARDAVDALVALCPGRTSLAVQAIRALSSIGCADHRVRSNLVALWLAPPQSQDHQLQLAVALCRLKIDADGVLHYMTQRLMASPDHAIRKTAAAALGCRHRHDLDVVPALLAAALNDKDEEVRRIAQASLEQLHLSQEKAVRSCAKQLRESCYAETALRKSGRLAVPALIEALGASDSETRLKAARTLAYLGEVAAEAAPPLIAVMRDKDLDIRLSAAKSLWNITKRDDLVVPVLADLLEEKWSAKLEDESRRRFLQSVIEALWRIGPPAKTAMPALIVMTKHPNRLVRESAQNALRRIETPAAN